MILFGQRPETGVKKACFWAFGRIPGLRLLFQRLFAGAAVNCLSLWRVTTVNRHQQPPVMICGQTF
jgi:hypothetical protein